MPQLPSSALKRSFYKQTFEIRHNDKVVYTHTFSINPSDLSVDEPARITPVQTLGGAYVSDFGQGLHTVSISGTTGYHKRMSYENGETDGYKEMHDFRRKIYRYYVETKSAGVELYWYNWEDEEYYKVVPLGFRLMRNKAEPTLYRYELRFTCIEVLQGVAGRANKQVNQTVRSAGRGTVPWASVVNAGRSALSELLTSFAKGGR